MKHENLKLTTEKNRRIRRLTKAFLGGTAVVLGLTVVAGLYKTNSFVKETADSGLRAIGLNVGETPVPPVFDNSKDEVIIGENNTKPVDQTNLGTIPSFDENGKPVFLFDLKLPEGTVVSGKKSLDAPFLPKAIVEEARKSGIKDTLPTPNVPAGTKIVAPIDGRAFVMAYEENGQLTPPVGVKVEFMGPDGTLYFYNISLDGIIAANAANIITINVDAPIMGNDNSFGREWEKGLLVKRGETLFTTNQEVTIFRFIQGGTNGDLGPGNRVPGNIQFITDTEGKLLVSA